MLIRSHPQGPVISQFLNAQLDHILVHRVAYYAGLHRVTPEWPKVARLSPPLRPPSWRRPAFGAGRPGLADLPQLRARTMAGLNANATTLAPHASAGAGSRPQPPGSGGAYYPARAALAMLWAVNAHGTVAPAPKQARSSGGKARRTIPAQPLTNTATNSPTQDRTESGSFKLRASR